MVTEYRRDGTDWDEPQKVAGYIDSVYHNRWSVSLTMILNSVFKLLERGNT